MENIVYERDYAEEHRRAAERADLESSIFDASIDTGFWKAYGEMMDAIPKVIVPEDKAAYEDLLPRLDELARRLGGKIRGEVRKAEQLATALNPLLDYAEEQTGRDRTELFNELVSFLAPYANRLDEGIKKYIEFIGGQA